MISEYNVFLSRKIVLVLANSVDPDEMPHNAAFHLGLYSLAKYTLILGVTCNQRTSHNPLE